MTSPGCARVSDRSLGPELGGTPGPGSGCSLTPEPESDLSQPQPPAPQYGDAGNVYTESMNVIFSYVRIYVLYSVPVEILMSIPMSSDIRYILSYYTCL